MDFYIKLTAMEFKIITGHPDYPVSKLNEDKTDNRVENLEWCNQSYNMGHGTGNNRRSSTLKGRKTMWNSKPVLQMSLDGKEVARWESTMEVERTLGFKNTDIGACCYGRM